MSSWGDLESFCHRYLQGGLLCFLSKKTLKLKCGFEGSIANVDLGLCKPKSRASRIRNLGTLFFLHLITCLRTQLCTSHFVHLKKLFKHVCMLLKCTSLCTYYKDGHVFYLQFTINVFQIYFLISLNEVIFYDDL